MISATDIDIRRMVSPIEIGFIIIQVISAKDVIIEYRINVIL